MISSDDHEIKFADIFPYLRVHVIYLVFEAER